MKLDVLGLLGACSYALDCVEAELVHVTSRHAKRVAYMSICTAEKMGVHGNALQDLTACALLHDNALTQYIQEEFHGRAESLELLSEIPHLGLHCSQGEENIRDLPFSTDVSGVILYHHENADGSGPFGKPWREVPLFARISPLCDLLDACFAHFPPEEEEEEDPDLIKVAVIGKPNAGKSSLVNQILGEERVIVSNVAGTTRDAIDSRFTNDKGSFVFIDTAGMRKKSKIEEDIEKYSVLRATMAIDRADVCLIMIDATEGVTEQDTKVAGMAHEAGKASIIVVNKWDLVEKDDKTMARMTEEIRRDLAYMTYAPILFISAKTGQRVDKLFDMIDYVANQAAFRVTTGMLNTVLADAQTRVQPPTDKGRRLKIYYMTQARVKPPHFVVFCKDRRLFHFSYQRYLENCIRSTFRLEGTPIILSIREKGDKED